MSDRESLLDAVFATEADDAPRLVYADWLDEHGEPAQAAFIRAQVELARKDPDSDEHARLDDLWDRLVAELGPGVVGPVMLLRTDFRRGLPEGPIHVAVPRLHEQSPHWWPRLPIRKVSVALSPLDVGEFIRIPYLTRLTHLQLTGEDPHGLVMPRLVKCHLLRDLQGLDLSQFHLGFDAAKALASAEVFGRLRDLLLPPTLRPNRELGRLLRERYREVCRY